MRLDKFLSNAGMGSRKDVTKIIKEKRVTINEQIETVGKTYVSDDDIIKLDDRVVSLEKHVYIMLNKPKRVITATKDDKHQTVMDLIQHPQKEMLFPLGRLDRNTTGLLIITNDGQLGHQLLSPKKKVDKTYVVTLKKAITDEAIKQLETGVELSDFTTQPASVKVLRDDCIELTITEGKFHQVKRMMHAVENQVEELHRKSFGRLVLDPNLNFSESRKLTDDEIKLLFSHV
ncbi:pseudouridine synthase [Aliicoccus persicus]|uniref:Pseudouridine synthase n=1 Tax=Aliicoccus persicus TaxID=930138 RepID=A0A662Z1Q5_9STAP|nr:pseudouridine synthase [Aliicoccus persicus]SEV87851.1 16S rRNA pseudouridine516 synthase [Aliicoccus persicus]HJE19992.1 rRNA pseudouridine synthase [Aliicoccus persicus]